MCLLNIMIHAFTLHCKVVTSDAHLLEIIENVEPSSLLEKSV